MGATTPKTEQERAKRETEIISMLLQKHYKNRSSLVTVALEAANGDKELEQEYLNAIVVYQEPLLKYHVEEHTNATKALDKAREHERRKHQEMLALQSSVELAKFKLVQIKRGTPNGIPLSVLAEIG